VNQPAQGAVETELSLLVAFKYLAVCALFFLLFSHNIFAATDNQTSGAIIMPQVAAENLKIATDLNGGSVIPFTFTLNNVENRSSFDMGYRVYVVDSKKDVYFQKDFPKLFILAPFEKQNIESSFDLPQTIPSGNYLLQVNAISPSGVDLGQTEAKVKISGSNAGVVTFGNMSISSGDQKSPEGRGIVVNPGDTINAHITVTSTKELIVKQKYKIYGGENFYEGEVKDAEARTIKVGENKYDFSVTSPEKSGIFAMAYWLVDTEGQQVSPINRFAWGVWGNLAGLNYLTTDKTSAKIGENVDVEVAFIPPVTRENIGEVTVKVWIGDDFGEKKLDFSKQAQVLVPVSLRKDMDKPAIMVVVEKDGKVILDYKTSDKGSLVKNVQNETNSLLKNKNTLYLGLGIFSVVVLALAFFFIKNKRNAAKVAIFLIFGLSSIFLLKTDAFSSLSSSAYFTLVPSINYCNPPSSYFAIENFFLNKNGSATAAAQNTLFRPGDTIRYRGNVASTAFCYPNGGGTTHNLGGTGLGSTSSSNWDATFTIPASYLGTTTGTDYAQSVWEGPIQSGPSPGGVHSNAEMTITVGPQAISSTSMFASIPACSNTNYNATFNFTGISDGYLASNYDIEYATDSTFTTGFGSITTGLSLKGPKTYTTTGTPFGIASTYYWRVKVRGPQAGSAITTVAPLAFGPVTACAPSAPGGLTLSGVPSCNDTGFGQGLSFNWTWSGGGFTSYDIRLSKQNTYDVTSTVNKNVTTSPPTTGIGGWSGPISSTGNLALQNKTTYYWSVRANSAGGASAWSSDYVINAVPPCIPANPSNLLVSTNTCSGTSPQVAFTFVDNSISEDNFWVDISYDAYTSPIATVRNPSVWGTKTIVRSLAQKVGNGGAVTFTWDATLPLGAGDVDPLTAGNQLVPKENTVYYWRVKAHNTGGDSSHVYPPNTTTPPGIFFTTASCTAPANPISLIANAVCNGSIPDITLRFRDFSNNEDLFWIDVNTSAWTSESAPSPWGTKTINRTAAEKSANTGTYVDYIWTSSDPLSGGPPAVPVANTTYYWRVKAHNNTSGLDSAHIYPANSTTPPGNSFTVPTCAYDLSLISLTNTNSKTTFDVGEVANMQAVVKNNAANPSPDTVIYFFPDGSGMPNCPTVGVSTPPNDSAGTPMSFAVASIPGVSTSTISFSFKVRSTPTTPSVTGYAYVVPSCSFAPSAGIDPDFTNNSKGFTYIVSVDRFFETVGGDVGAVGTTSVGFDSSTLIPPLYQSDYVIASSSINPKVKSRNNLTLNNYTRRLINSGSIYDYFDSRYANKAGFVKDCDSITGANGFRYCNGNLTFSSGSVVPSGNTLFFVDGDLQIKQNLILPAGSVTVFVVKGNIIVDLSVTQIDGVYIARKGFTDSDLSSAASGIAQNGALTVNGSVYVDGDGGILDLKRYFSGPYNNTLPSDRFVYQPGYLIQLANFFNFKSIVWNEIAP